MNRVRVFKMIIKLSFLFVFLSCSSQKNLPMFKDCMNSKFLSTGEDFYGNLKKIEKELININVLENNSKKSYLNAFKTLFSKNEKEENNNKKSYLKLNKSHLQKIKSQIYISSLFDSCTHLNENKIEYNSMNIQKYFLRQFVYKPIDDAEVLDGLFLFTDFDDDDLRFNITYIYLLNMDKKYSNVPN